MTQIVLKPGNPRDLRPKVELVDLAESLRLEGFDVKFELTEERGYAVTHWEVLEVILRNLPQALPVLDRIERIIRDWQKSRQKTNHRRKQYATIYGPDGQVLKTVELDAEAEE